MKYSGGTFSGYKSILCAREIMVLGHRCTPEGRLPDLTQVNKISNWGTLKDLTDVCAFVGTIGVCRMFIRHFTHRAHHLVKLTRKDMPFEYSPDQVAVQEDLKQALLDSPALRPLDYMVYLGCISYSLSRHFVYCGRIYFRTVRHRQPKAMILHAIWFYNSQ